MLDKHADSFAKIFEVLFKDGYDPDASFVGNIDKSKDSDGKIFFHRVFMLKGYFSEKLDSYSMIRTSSLRCTVLGQDT